MHVARTPLALSGSSRSSVSASTSIAPRIGPASASIATTSRARCTPASRSRRSAMASPSPGVAAFSVATGNALMRSTSPIAATLSEMKSGLPFECPSARRTSAEAVSDVADGVTILSAPETCSLPREARIFTEKRRESLMEISVVSLRRRFARSEICERPADAFDSSRIRNKRRHGVCEVGKRPEPHAMRVNHVVYRLS